MLARNFFLNFISKHSQFILNHLGIKTYIFNFRWICICINLSFMRYFIFYHSLYLLQIPGISPPLPPRPGSPHSDRTPQCPLRCLRAGACSPQRSAPPRTGACLQACGCAGAYSQLTRALTRPPPRSNEAQIAGSCWEKEKGAGWCYPSPPPPGWRASRLAPRSRWAWRYQASKVGTGHWESNQHR